MLHKWKGCAKVKGWFREGERGREGEETFPLLYPAAAKESPNEGRGILKSRGREKCCEKWWAVRWALQTEPGSKCFALTTENMCVCFGCVVAPIKIHDREAKHSCGCTRSRTSRHIYSTCTDVTLTHGSLVETHWSRKKDFCPYIVPLRLPFPWLISTSCPFDAFYLFSATPSASLRLPPLFSSAVLPLIYACSPVPA